MPLDLPGLIYLMHEISSNTDSFKLIHQMNQETMIIFVPDIQLSLMVS